MSGWAQVHRAQRKTNNAIRETVGYITLSCGHQAVNDPAVTVPGTSRRLYVCPLGCPGFQRRRKGEQRQQR